MEQAMQPIQRFQSLRRVGLAGQQGASLDPRQSGHEMGEADKASQNAVAIESVGEIGMPWAPNDIALVPIGARVPIKQRSHAVAIEPRIAGRRRLSELPEVGISREGADTCKLQLEQRQMRFVEV